MREPPMKMVDNTELSDHLTSGRSVFDRSVVEN